MGIENQYLAIFDLFYATQCKYYQKFDDAKGLSRQDEFHKSGHINKYSKGCTTKITGGDPIMMLPLYPVERAKLNPTSVAQVNLKSH